MDPYSDPATGVLRNRLGIRGQGALDQAEAGLTNARLIELAQRYSVRPTGDLEELRGIHRHLFQDLYDWAGQLRTVDIRKPDGQPFLPASRIQGGAGFVFDELRGDNHLRGMSRQVFVERLAYHYDALNYLHPFREGNGRAQRVFWSRVARDAGWELDWKRASPEQNIEASRVAMERSDLGSLREMFDSLTPNYPSQKRGLARADLLAFGRTSTNAAVTSPEQSAAAAKTTQRARGSTSAMSGVERQQAGVVERYNATQRTQEKTTRGENSTAATRRATDTTRRDGGRHL